MNTQMRNMFKKSVSKLEINNKALTNASIGFGCNHLSTTNDSKSSMGVSEGNNIDDGGSVTSKSIARLSRTEALEAMRINIPEQCTSGKNAMFAMYSPVYGGIVTDPTIMTVPMDDHMVHRGHAVFDTATCIDGKIHGLDKHLDRLLSSAQKAKIDPDSIACRQELKQIILETVAASGERDVYIRYWLSAGRGDFNVTPRFCSKKALFYVMVHGHSPGKDEDGNDLRTQGLREATVSIPLKPKLLATMKSTNYLINSLCSMEAKEKGGYLGLQLDEDNNLGEFSTAAVAIVDQNRILRSPFPERILASTTLERVFNLCEKFLIPAGILKGVQYDTIPEADAYKAIEILSCGGGTVKPVLELDKNQIGDGKPGPVFHALDSYLGREKDIETVDRVVY